MKRFVMAITLSCVLASSAFAGEMPMVGPAPAPAQTIENSAGDIPSVGVSGQLASDALSALLSIFGFLAV